MIIPRSYDAPKTVWCLVTAMAQLIARGVESESPIERRWFRLAKLLQFQIQQCLDQQCCDRFQVHMYKPIYGDRSLCPAISILKNDDKAASACWIINFLGDKLLDDSESDLKDVEQGDVYSQVYSRLAIADYWALIPSQAELRTYHTSTASGYQQQNLFHVGQQTSPTVAPCLTVKVQEPLPLQFLTRTLRGRCNYAATIPPLQVLATTSRREA